MDLKDKLTTEKYNELNNKALICELGYYIGTKKNIDEYIKKNILEVFEGVDSYILFYIFCEFVVDIFNDSEVQDIYELIDYNYIRLCSMFIDKFGSVE